ncbi:transposase [Streptomyces seoulensis]
MGDAEWVAVRDLLPVPGRLAGRGGRPEGYCHRRMIDAIRYLVDNGIKWRALPSDFPPWSRVCAFFARWQDAGLVAELHDQLREAVRRAEDRDQEPSSGGHRLAVGEGGRKRHLFTDTLGLLPAVLVTPAYRKCRASSRPPAAAPPRPPRTAAATSSTSWPTTARPRPSGPNSGVTCANAASVEGP